MVVVLTLVGAAAGSQLGRVVSGIPLGIDEPPPSSLPSIFGGMLLGAFVCYKLGRRL